MGPKIRRVLLSLATLTFVGVASGADDVLGKSEERIGLWPEGHVPDFDMRQTGGWLVFHDVAHPSTRAFFLVAQGGSYMHTRPGGDYAEALAYFKERGIRCAELVYRSPRPSTGPRHRSAWQDVQRAVRICRHRANDWDIDPNRIGIIGFSAGGHLSLMAAVSSKTAAYADVDELDRTFCNVNFAVAVYPAYTVMEWDNMKGGFIGESKGRENDFRLTMAPELKFDAATPPICIFHGDADYVPPIGSVLVYQKLRTMGVSAELHMLARRPHGFVANPKSKKPLPPSSWKDRVVEWLGVMDLL